MGSPPPKTLTQSEQTRTQEFPCDGIPRFRVKGLGKNQVTYSAAYEGIFLSEGGYRQAGGGRVYTHRAIQRLGKLNVSYWASARVFILSKMTEDNAKLANVVAEVEAMPLKKPAEPHSPKNTDSAAEPSAGVPPPAEAPPA